MFDYRVPQVWVDYTFLAGIPDDFTGQQLVVCLELTVTGGFRLYCDYKFGNWNANTQMCGTYYYRDSIYFYSNGIVKPNVIIYGPGFDDTKVYNVLYRTDHDIASPSPKYFYRWEGVQWTQKTVEGNFFDDFNNRLGYQSGYEWRIKDGSGHYYYLDPRTTDALPGSGRGADMYALRTHSGEYEPQDDSTPLRGFLNGESISALDVTDWYVAFTPLQASCIQGNPMPPLISTGADSEVPSGY